MMVLLRSRQAVRQHALTTKALIPDDVRGVVVATRYSFGEVQMPERGEQRSTRKMFLTRNRLSIDSTEEVA